MDLSKERKWSKLRGRLHMLGYNQYLGAESVPLVEELFSDLVHTTESLRNSQQSTVKSEKESQNCDVLLARQNQDLELELMMVKSEKAHVTKELKAYITKLDEEIGLQKSLNKQHVQKIHSLEQECNEKARIIHQLSGKIAEVQAVEPHDASSHGPHSADLHHVELTKLKRELGNSQEQIQLLNIQIDELQTTNNTLEQKLNAAGQKSSSKVAELTSKNHELCQEITDIRNLAKMMEMEKRQKLKTAKTEVQDLKDIIHKHKDVIKDLEAQLGKKRTEVIDPELIKSQLGDELGNLREQNEKLKKMVDFLSVEKSRLQDKLQKMMSIEKVLVLELEGWRTKYGICGKDRLPSRLDAFVKSLEEERDSYRLEAEHSRNIRVYVTPIYSSDMKSSHGIENVQQEPDVIRKLKEELRRVEENLQQVTREKVCMMEELNHNLHIQDEISNLKEDKTSEDKIEQELAEKVLLAKELQCKQHTLEMLELQGQLRKAEEKNQQLASEKDAQIEILKQRQEKHAAAIAEIAKLKEALGLAETSIASDPLMEELKDMQQQHEKQMADANVEILQLKQKLQMTKEKMQELEELKLKQTHDPETSALMLTLKENLKKAEEKVEQVKSEKDTLKEELKQQKMQHEQHNSNTFVEIADLKEKLRVAEKKIQQVTAKKDLPIEVNTPIIMTHMDELKHRTFANLQQKQNEEHISDLLKLKEKIKMTEDTLRQVKSEKDRQMEELKKIQLKHDEEHSKTSAEILKLEEKLRLAEQKIQQMKDEKDSFMEELQSADQSSKTSPEMISLKEKLRVANEKIQQLTAEKDSLTEDLKEMQLQNERLALTTSSKIAKLNENLRLSEEKIQQVTKEKDSQMKELEMWRADTSSNTPMVISKLKEKLRVAQEKVQLATSEKDSLMEELKSKTSSTTCDEISKLKEKVKLAEKNIQQLTEEVDSLIQELKQNIWSYASDEISSLKEKLRLAEGNVQQLTAEKDSLTEELKKNNCSITSDDISELKKKLRLAEEKVQQLTDKKNSKQPHSKDQSATESGEVQTKEKPKLTEEKIQRLTNEKDPLIEHLKQKIGSHTSGDISDLKEKLRLAEEKIQKLTEEKDSQHAEWEQKQLQHYKQSANKSAEILQLKKQLRQAEEQLLQVTAENNSLAEELKKLRLTEEKILQVTAEKDSLMEELQLKSNLNISEELSKLKEKVRLAEEKLLRVTAEKVSLEEELKMGCNLNSKTSAEVLKLKEKLRLAEEKIQQVTAEKESLREEIRRGLTSVVPYEHGQQNRILDQQDVVHSVRERNVERQMDTRSAALVQNAEESPGQRTAASGFRRQQDQIQDALLDLQQMLSVKTDELHDAHSQMEKLEDIIESLSKQLYQHRQDAKVFQISYSALCFKKDVLQEDVAKKTKRLAVLHEQLSKKLDFELKSHDRAMATHRMLENHQETLGRLKRHNELIIGEYRRLQDDMAAITEEKQHALMEKGDALRERDELKQRMNSYVDTVARIENILKTKDQENLDLLERIRTAHSDLQVREHRLKCAEDLNGSIRLELLLSEKERQNLCEALGHKEQEVKELMQDLQTYKAQAATLAHGMSQLEAELRVLQEEKVVLLAELATVRDVCVKLDSDKEIAAQQLLQKSMELERATSKQEDALSEAALLKEHLASEKLTLRNMEAMLSTSRKEMFQAHQAASDKEAELTTLRHKLTQADNKIMSHAREVTTLRGKVTQLQTQMEVLTSKVLEREGHHGTSSQEISFMPKRASSPIDHADVPHQMDPYNSVQEEISFGPTSQKIPGDPGLG
ncbi:centrosomal protein of 135 kDa-like [Corythoichthys intestinalis]|uniref:centrosomal protein of 135 kDa-like n=1 Tax=Corythoichthys intestinalis TaxID=161448 RepID=UPI0025A6805B|nr:centrosomal protein of 135 kDa-like [Corythoichthys intestinalis]